MTLSEIRALLEKATPTANGCLEWPGAKDSKGYPITGRNIRVHRWVLELTVGRKLGRFEFACHHCDNPPCINPDHLFVGSPKDNVRDMMEKGRGNHAKTPAWRAALSASAKAGLASGRRVLKRGHDSPNAKLTEDQARSILADPRSQREIARSYSVNQATISLIKTGKMWAHLSGRKTSEARP